MFQKKILVAFDGLHYQPDSVQFAISMARSSHSLLVGVFLHDLRYLNLSYSYGWDMPIVSYPDINRMETEDKVQIDKNIELFTNACGSSGIQFKVHKDSGVPLQELLHESGFADLLIIDSRTGFFRVNENDPSSFLKDLLLDSHCPVLIVPGKTENIEHIVLTYDGNENSVFAIKQFAYLFNEWADKKTTLIAVNSDSSNHVKENQNVKDLLEKHFRNISFHVMHGNPILQIEKFIQSSNDQKLVVMGSFGRSAVSRFFSTSVGNTILQDLNTPLFITHR